MGAIAYAIKMGLKIFVSIMIILVLNIGLLVNGKEIMNLLKDIMNLFRKHLMKILGYTFNL